MKDTENSFRSQKATLLQLWKCGPQVLKRSLIYEKIPVSGIFTKKLNKGSEIAQEAIRLCHMHVSGLLSAQPSKFTQNSF